MFKISGVQEWHEKGYKGKGIRVMVAEPDPNNYHAKSVEEIIKMYAPDCEVIMYDYENFKEIDMAEYAIKNKVDIINTSYGINYPDNTFVETRAKEQYKRILDAGIFVVNSAGNEGENGIKDNGLVDDRIINVGAVDKKLEIESYSSFDNTGKVDCCGMVGLVLKDGTILSGTSEASPYVAGLIACILSKNKMNLKDLALFMAKNSLDLPQDNKTGVGLFRLPCFDNYLSVRMTKPNGKEIFVHKDFVYNAIKKGYTV